MRADGLAAPDIALPLSDRVHASPLRVIARLRADIGGLPTTAASQDRLARRLWNQGHAMPGWHAFGAVPAVVMEVDPDSLASLMADLDVVSVEEDLLASPGLTTSGAAVQAPVGWALGNTGEGVAVVVIDTGIDRAHPFFGGRVVHEACFSSSYAPHRATSVCPNGMQRQTGAGAAAPCSVNGCSHGTHVAGIAAGYQSDTFAGVARNAPIIAIQVFSRFDEPSICGKASCVRSYTSDQLRALDYVLELRSGYTIGAVNMSLGGAVHTSQKSCDAANPSAKHAIDALRAAGIPTVISAGNDGYLNAISAPGCISSAISVGNTTNADTLFMPSNIATFISMVAPGTSIRSAVPGGGFAALTGTSMAAPHVAGALALLRQANPDASVDDLVVALRAGGHALRFSFVVSQKAYTYVVPRLDVAGALSALCARCIAPATGWWWTPSEPGRGFSMEVRDGRMFLGAFLYDTDGTPLWYAANGPLTQAGFSGELVKFGFGQKLATAYRPPQLLGTAGPVSVVFSSSTSGTLTWAGGSIAIQRFPIDGRSVVDPEAGAPETGWWWNGNEPGTGWFLEIQGANLYLSGYVYDDDGRPVWYASSSPMLNATAFDGDLQRYAGGQTLTGGYRPPVTATTVGRISLRFSSTTTAILVLPQGRTIPLTRFTSF